LIAATFRPLLEAANDLSGTPARIGCLLCALRLNPYRIFSSPFLRPAAAILAPLVPIASTAAKTMKISERQILSALSAALWDQR
jgi:hypothetical protein